jgi:hypothetical protein
MLVDGGQLRGGDFGRLRRGAWGLPSTRGRPGVGQLTLQVRDALLLRELKLQLGDALLRVLLIHQQMIALRKLSGAVSSCAHRVAHALRRFGRSRVAFRWG